MKILIGLAIISVLFAGYVVWLRPWMRDKEWAKPFFAFMEPVEIALWSKSETILKARAKMVVGFLLTIMTQIGTLDITPLMPIVPERYRTMVTVAFNLIPMILVIGGWVDEKLRKDTGTPLPIVALPDAAVAASPALQELVEKSKEVKVEAATIAPVVEAAEASVEAEKV